jgi:hypothetical protein
MWIYRFRNDVMKDNQPKSIDQGGSVDENTVETGSN